MTSNVFLILTFIPMMVASHSITMKTIPSTEKSIVHSNNTNTNNTLSGFICTNPLVDCAGHGICISNGTVNFACKCDNGYNSFNCGDNIQCCYQQHKRIIVFLMSLFIGWAGVPYFIVGSTGLGICTLVLFVGGCCLLNCGKVFMSDDSDCCRTVSFAGGCIGGVAFLTAIFWSMVVFFMVAAETETFKDANGQPIAPW
jgi:hypothetical protein